MQQNFKIKTQTRILTDKNDKKKWYIFVKEYSIYLLSCNWLPCSVIKDLFAYYGICFYCLLTT